MHPEMNHYELLEVSPKASQAIIKAAYRCLTQLNHPDKHAGTPAAIERQTRINTAYAVLSKPAERLRYDQRLGLHSFVERRNGPLMAAKGGAGVVGGEHPGGAVDAGARAFAFRPLE